ncbi:amino acid ABC transporter permease [Streptomyces sp. NPDC090075]|uniref:amino acid ABC transporter permease n=1 Tax=unclassified Streptomyces TaxID=2593676 RepID=UPI00382BD29B
MSSDTLATSSAAPGIPEHADTLRIVPQRRYGQWAAAVVVLVLLGFAVDSVLGNKAFQWGVVADYFTSDSVLRGLWLTLWLTAVVMVLGFALGTLLAAFRLSANPVLRAVSWGYVWLFRSIPILVQLLLWFNIGALYPRVLGVRTVDLLSRWRRWRRIVLPQAMRAIVPPAGNMLIGALKGTSIVSVIAVNDLLFSVQLVYHQTYQVIPLLMVATLWYTVVTSVLGIAQYYVEKHYARGTGATR